MVESGSSGLQEDEHKMVGDFLKIATGGKILNGLQNKSIREIARRARICIPYRKFLHSTAGFALTLNIAVGLSLFLCAARRLPIDFAPDFAPIIKTDASFSFSIVVSTHCHLVQSGSLLESSFG